MDVHVNEQLGSLVDDQAHSVAEGGDWPMLKSILCTMSADNGNPQIKQNHPQRHENYSQRV